MAMAERVAQMPKNQLHMMKLLVNQVIEQMGLSTTQLVGTLLDGAARHTPEGTDFSRRALEDVRGAVSERDDPFGDRKSTRLNSSHANISYAVFCLKKNKVLPHRLQSRPR